MEMLDDAPYIVHELSRNWILIPFVVNREPGAIDTNTTRQMRHAPLPFQCLADSSLDVRPALCDHSGDVRHTELEQLRSLNRPLFDNLCSDLPVIRGILTNQPDSEQMRLHLEVYLEVEHAQTCNRDKSG